MPNSASCRPSGKWRLEPAAVHVVRGGTGIRSGRPGKASAFDGMADLRENRPMISDLALSIFSGSNFMRRAVHAVAEAGRLGTVREDMTEMAAASGAMHFGARHAEAAIHGRLDGASRAAPRSSANRSHSRTWCPDSNSSLPHPAQTKSPTRFSCSAGWCRRARFRAGAAPGIVPASAPGAIPLRF